MEQCGTVWNSVEQCVEVAVVVVGEGDSSNKARARSAVGSPDFRSRCHQPSAVFRRIFVFIFLCNYHEKRNKARYLAKQKAGVQSKENKQKCQKGISQSAGNQLDYQELVELQTADRASCS